MRGHVVGARGRVPKVRVTVGDHSREETLQVSADARIGVLAEDQRGAGVVKGDRAGTPVHLRLPRDPLDLIGGPLNPQPPDIDREAPRGEYPTSFRLDRRHYLGVRTLNPQERAELRVRSSFGDEYEMHKGYTCNVRAKNAEFKVIMMKTANVLNKSSERRRYSTGPRTHLRSPIPIQGTSPGAGVGGRGSGRVHLNPVERAVARCCSGDLISLTRAGGRDGPAGTPASRWVPALLGMPLVPRVEVSTLLPVSTARDPYPNGNPRRPTTLGRIRRRILWEIEPPRRSREVSISQLLRSLDARRPTGRDARHASSFGRYGLPASSSIEAELMQ